MLSGAGGAGWEEPHPASSVKARAKNSDGTIVPLLINSREPFLTTIYGCVNRLAVTCATADEQINVNDLI